MNSKIISIILGIVLLSSVTSFSPIPVDAAITVDATFFCHWKFPQTVGDPYNRVKPIADYYESESNYTHVMPLINAWGNQFGVPELYVFRSCLIFISSNRII